MCCCYDVRKSSRDKSTRNTSEAQSLRLSRRVSAEKCAFVAVAAKVTCLPWSAPTLRVFLHLLLCLCRLHPLPNILEQLSDAFLVVCTSSYAAASAVSAYAVCIAVREHLVRGLERSALVRQQERLANAVSLSVSSLPFRPTVVFLTASLSVLLPVSVCLVPTTASVCLCCLCWSGPVSTCPRSYHYVSALPFSASPACVSLPLCLLSP